MQKTIRELVAEIELLLTKKDGLIHSEDIVTISKSEILDLTTKLSFTDPKGLDELFPCPLYLLDWYIIFTIDEIYEQYKIWEGFLSLPPSKDDISIELLGCLFFAAYKDLYYVISRDGKVLHVEGIDDIIFPVSKDLRSFLNAFVDTVTCLGVDGEYKNRWWGIDPWHPLFREKLREQSPELVESTLTELKLLRSDPDLSTGRQKKLVGCC